MKDKLKLIQEKALAAFQEAKEIKDIDELKVKFLGKKGELTAILKEMGKLSAEERPIIGQMANEVRAEIEKMLDESKKRLEAAEMAARLENEKIDVTMPGKKAVSGHQHPMNKVIDEICDIFIGMGFKNGRATFFTLNAGRTGRQRNLTDRTAAGRAAFSVDHSDSDFVHLEGGTKATELDISCAAGNVLQSVIRDYIILLFNLFSI